MENLVTSAGKSLSHLPKVEVSGVVFAMIGVDVACVRCTLAIVTIGLRPGGGMSSVSFSLRASLCTVMRGAAPELITGCDLDVIEASDGGEETGKGEGEQSGDRSSFVGVMGSICEV